MKALTFKEKRSYKRLARVYTIWKYIVLLCLPIVYFLAFQVKDHLKTESQINILVVSLAVIIVLGALSAFIFWTVAMEYKTRRSRYLNQIKRWRQRRFFNIAIDLLDKGDVNSVKSIYDKQIHDARMRELLFGFLLGIIRSYENPETIVKYRNHITEIKNDWNPDKVFD